MKNIISITLILILPLCIYFLLNKNSTDNVVIASNSNLPSIVTFSSSMCLDCQKLKKVLVDVEKEYNNRVNFISVDASSNNKVVKEKIKKHKVVLVPTMIFLDINGIEKKKIEGYIPKEELIVEIEALTNG